MNVMNIIMNWDNSPDTGTKMQLVGNSALTISPQRVYFSAEGTDTPYSCVWLSLQGKGHTDISPTVSLWPSGNRTMDEFVDVESLIGTAGPLLLQVSTFSSHTKGASCPDSASTCEKSLSPTSGYEKHALLYITLFYSILVNFKVPFSGLQSNIPSY